MIGGKHVLWDVSAVINGVDLSDHLQAITFIVTLNEIVCTPHGVGQVYSKPGMQVITDPVLTFYQDFAAAKVYATFIGLWQNKTVFNAVAKTFSGARSTTNPEWTLPVFVNQLPIINGARGDAHMSPVTLSVGGLVTVATS